MTNLASENKQLEYKEVSVNKLPKSIWETVSAFANTDGGKIILGVKEAKKNAVFVPQGITDVNKLKIDFLNLQRDKDTISSPVISDDDIQKIMIDGKELLEINIPKMSYKAKPVYLKNNIKNTFVREHESDCVASSEQLRYFLREADANVDSELLDNADLDDLNIVDLQNYRALLVEKSGDSDYLEKSYLDLLESIGLYRKDLSSSQKVFKLNKAALLLFGKYNRITTFFPDFFLDFIVKDTSSDVDYLDRIYTANEKGHPQNIFSFYNQVNAKIESRIENKFELDGMSRKDNGEHLLKAIREGLVNTLVHADYAGHVQIKISLYKNYIEFNNPGELRISRKRFISGGVSEPRNPSIFPVFLRAKLGEHTGSGGHRIYDTADKLNLRTPELSTNIMNTQLVIWTIPLVESILETIPIEWRKTYQFVSERLIVSYSEISDLYKSSYEGHKILNEMVEQGLLLKTGKNKGTKYALAEQQPELQMRLNQYIRTLQNQFLKK